LLFKKRKQILFHFPHNKQDEKEGQRPRQGLNTNNMGGLYISYRFRTRKKGVSASTVKVLEVTTDESKLQIPCNCDVKFSDSSNK